MALTIRELRALASELDLTITTTRKADIVAEILEQLADTDEEEQEP